VTATRADPAVDLVGTDVRLWVCYMVFSLLLWAATALSSYKPWGKRRGRSGITGFRVFASRSFPPDASQATAWHGAKVAGAPGSAYPRCSRSMTSSGVGSGRAARCNGECTAGRWMPR
jgi:hypothetical protein